MKRSKRTMTSVNVEVPEKLLAWLDAKAVEFESSRSSVLRMLVKKAVNEEGGAKK